MMKDLVEMYVRDTRYTKCYVRVERLRILL
jgi:hypothetical protein